ncbi:TIGR00645 family protein [Neisseria gonorrhoeae]
MESRAFVAARKGNVSSKISKTRTGYGFFAKMIFASRWLQVPIYAGLTVVRAICAYKFLKSLKHLVMNLDVSDENAIMLAVLNLIDVVMIANLLTMVQIGGYESFVSRLRIDDHPDRSEWLSHVNAPVLKVRLSMSIIGIHPSICSKHLSIPPICRKSS